MTEWKIEPIKPALGSIVHVDRSTLLKEEFARHCVGLLKERGVLVFPKIGLTDQEQLAFTEALGARVNFTTTVAGSTSADGVYTITLDKEHAKEPEYVLGTFFWHMDGVTIDIAPPLASVLTCRKTAPQGGQTEFASTYAAYDALPEDEKQALEGVRVVHSVVAAVREVTTYEELDPAKRDYKAEHPLVWTHESGRKSLLIGYTADHVVGRSQAHGRALLARLLEWTAQPSFTYRHHWQEGDLVVWDNTGALHRVLPYAEDSGRSMRRTSVAGTEKAA